MGKPADGESSCGGDSEPRGEDMTLDKDENSSNVGNKHRNDQDEALHRSQEAVHGDQESENINNQDAVPDKSW